jgi:flagella basal body P-ring formation protein FlgA
MFLAVFSPARPLYAAERLSISIPAVVQLEGDACALSDIAAIEGARELTERVEMLLLSVKDGVITREQVIDALKVSGLEGVRIELKMPAAVTVMIVGDHSEFEAGGVPPGDLAALVKSLAAWDGDVEVQHQGSVPSGRLVAPASIVPGTSSATLRFRDESGRERSLAVRLVWTQPALVLTRSIKKGEVLKESDFVVRQIRVNKAGMYASRASDVVGYSLRRSLSQGEAIVLNLIADAPIIERGKGVTIIVRDEGLMVKAKGEALENGALGDEIKVRNIASKAVLTAIVIASDTVEVKVP